MTQDQILIEAREAVEQNRLEEALQILTNQLLVESNEGLFLKGEILFKLERWGESHNTFATILELFPQNTQAASYIELTQNILSFYHKDLLNP